MEDTSQSLVVHAPVEEVPPPRRGRAKRYLDLHALQVIEMLGLLPLAASVVAFSLLSQRRLPKPTGKMGRPKTYSDASILIIALIGRIWRLSYPEVCLWLTDWPALASACGLPTGHVIHSAHLSRRVCALGAYPIWLLYLYLVWRAIQVGLIRGRDVIIDSTLLAAWTRLDISAAWSYPASKGRVFGYKVHTLLDRYARLPIFFLLSPANRNDLPFAYPLLWVGRFLLRLSTPLTPACLKLGRLLPPSPELAAAGCLPLTKARKRSALGIQTSRVETDGLANAARKAALSPKAAER